MSTELIARVQSEFPHRSNPDYAFYPEKYAKEEESYRARLVDEMARENIETNNALPEEKPSFWEEHFLNKDSDTKDKWVKVALVVAAIFLIIIVCLIVGALVV
jgi:hypothetical protein